MLEFDYEQDLSVDPYALEEEWLKQPGLYMKYSAQVAIAQTQRDRLKEKLDMVKAELELAIRSNPQGKGRNWSLEKVTEAAVVATILLQPEYKEADEALIQCNYELNILQSAVKAFDHKRSALENVVKLWLGNYFSGPKEPRDIPTGKRIIDIARDNISIQLRQETNRKAREEKVEVPPSGMEKSSEQSAIRTRQRRN